MEEPLEEREAGSTGTRRGRCPAGISTLARERGLPGVPLRRLYPTPTLGALPEALAPKT
ncbi:hypothetical protein ACIBQ3_02740 [Streptomyces rubiginosohelvolus]|uniref:hypothetical protein n=1 Tax=Streptomyces rubiginosohelvolus TaxID=67362 RepID=UPI00378D6B5C